MAQQKYSINLTKSDSTYGTKINGADVLKVYKGTFVQKFSVLRSDSAIIYISTNTFDAFGHVVITQGDTLHVYSDKLNYNDNTKIALLTDHVKMVDKDATLTTNILNYNTATKYGTYVEGGKLVNKDNTLTSKNGYYDAKSRDAYFRYNVVTTSPDALIKTDTMRYNSGTRITYFYGPTNIYGKKDKDTLYTENGTYNTKTEVALFGKKNRYSQGTKSLKGDSLMYDKLKGYGKAIKNITFEDTEQKMILKGNLGEYFKGEDKAVITQNPYAILITEQKDTSKTDTTKLAKPLQKKDDLQSVVNDVTNMAKDAKLSKQPLTLPKGLPAGKADSMAKAIAKMPAVKNTMPLVKDIKPADAQAALNAVQNMSQHKKDSIAKAIANMPAVKNAMPLVTDKLKDSLRKVALAATAPAAKNTKLPVGKSVTPVVKDGKPVVGDTAKAIIAKKDTATRMKQDTMYIGADTLETQVITYKALKDLQEKRRMAGIRDTSIKPRKPFVPYTSKTMPTFLSVEMPEPIFDGYNFMHRPLFTIVKPAPDTTQKKMELPGDIKLPVSPQATDKLAQATDKQAGVKPANKKPEVKPGPKPPATGTTVLGKSKLMADSLKAKHKADSILKSKPQLSDTSRIRILSAHHNVHIFKSDLQGKSDSLFYSSSDSVIRSYVKPMYWTQGAQLSGDTINLQLKNKKADNMDVFPSAFVVYIEAKDSTHFNQVAGKRMHVYFKDSKVSRATVNSNAETIYYNREKGKVTKMQHSVSGSINLNMKNGATSNAAFVGMPEHKIYDIKKVKEDDKILKGFIWKPKERPATKEDVINPKKPEPEKEIPKKGADGKTPVKGGAAKVTGAEKSAAAGKDSVKTTAPALKAPVMIKKDSTAAKSDTAAKKLPELKLKRDTVAKKPVN